MAFKCKTRWGDFRFGDVKSDFENQNGDYKYYSIAHHAYSLHGTVGFRQQIIRKGLGIIELSITKRTARLSSAKARCPLLRFSLDTETAILITGKLLDGCSRTQRRIQIAQNAVRQWVHGACEFLCITVQQ